MRFDRQAIATGIPLIDNQHGEYFNTVEKLFDLYEKNDIGKDEVRAVINKIEEYAQDNFDTEEQLMETEGYPDLDEHRSKHDTFKRRIDSYLDELDAAQDPVALLHRLQHLVVAWMETQIKQDDMKLAAFLKEKGYGG